MSQPLNGISNYRPVQSREGATFGDICLSNAKW